MLEFAMAPNKLNYDAIVVGSGPNGLACAIELAKKKLSVLVLERQPEIGGGGLAQKSSRTMNVTMMSVHKFTPLL